MAYLKPHHLFTSMMMLAGVSAFIIPAEYTEKFRPRIEGVFAPVARPAGALAAWASVRLAPPEQPQDLRAALALREENDELAQQNVKLQHDVEELRRVNAEREMVGDIRKLCTPVSVVGVDAGHREGLAVQASAFSGLRDGMPVLYSGGIVGTLQVGAAGGKVRLVTDPGFSVTVYFGTYRRVESDKPDNKGGASPPKGDKGKLTFVPWNKEPVLARGTGQGAMHCTMLTMTQVKAWGLAPGDWVVLEDPRWSDRLRGRRIGKVAGVAPMPTAPLFADVTIQPTSDLRQLREVMVLTGDKR